MQVFEGASFSEESLIERYQSQLRASNLINILSLSVSLLILNSFNIHNLSNNIFLFIYFLFIIIYFIFFLFYLFFIYLIIFFY